MPSYINYESTRKKKKYKKNILQDRKSKNRETDVTLKKQKFEKGLMTWVSYWRENPHRFVTEYLQLKPFNTFQKILLFMMFKSNHFLWFASRGLGKSYLVAIYGIVRCILYPGTIICIAAPTKGQSVNIIREKIEIFRTQSFLLALEIKDLNPGVNDPKVEFHNGSRIRVVTANDNARHNRANVLIVDEFILVSKDIITKVLKKFLTNPRRPGYLEKPEYKHLVENNTEIYLSSAKYKSEWYWERFKSFADAMIQGKNYFACGLPYTLGIQTGILLRQTIIDEMQESDFDPVSFSMEMECLPYGESENAFFSYKKLNKCRKIKMPSYPITNETFIQYKGNLKKNPFYKEKHVNEIRILSMDIALMPSKLNDLTVIHYIRAIPNGEEYLKLVEYTYTMEGVMTDDQVLILKRLFYGFECDVCVMDTAGNGISIYEASTKVTIDTDRGIEYPAWSAMNGTKEGRAYDPNAVPLIYSVGSGGRVAAQQNHEMANYSRTQFNASKIALLINENDGKKYLTNNYKKTINTAENYTAMILPYFQATRLISEMINLEMIIAGGFVKLQERSGQRKDRYKSLEYGLHYIKLQESELKVDNRDDSLEDYIIFV